jgi:hypothetical protein
MSLLTKNMVIFLHSAIAIQVFVQTLDKLDGPLVREVGSQHS